MTSAAAKQESALWDGLATWVAPEGLAAVRGLTDRLHSLEASGSIVSVILVVYGSTRLFRAVRRALNDLWGIDLEAVEEARGRVHRYGIRYGVSLFLLLLTAVLVAVLIVIKSGFVLLGSLGTRPPPSVLWILDLATSLGVTFALFVALFRYLPETDVTWSEAAKSALVSTLLFALGSELVTLYVHHKHTGDLYEGASAFVLAILWVYYSAQVFFLGACVGAVLRQRSTP